MEKDLVMILEGLEAQRKEYFKIVRPRSITDSILSNFPFGEKSENTDIIDEVSEIKRTQSIPTLVNEYDSDYLLKRFINSGDDRVFDVADYQGFLFDKTEYIEGGGKVGVIARLIQMFKGYKYIESRETDDFVYLPVAEIHCPKVENCKSEYVFSKGSSEGAKFKIGIFNLGLGGESSTEISLKSTFQVEGGCSVLLKPCRFRVDIWMDQFGKRHPEISIIEFGNGVKVESLENNPKFHYCTHRYETVKKVLDKFSANRAYFKHYYPASIVHGASHSEQMNIRKGAIVEIKAKVPLFDGLTPSLEFKSVLQKEFEYKFTLGGGYDYLGFYRNFSSSSYLWTWRYNGRK